MSIAMILWGVVFALAVIAEIATLQLVSIWFAAGALSAFIAAALQMPVMGQSVVFTVVSVLLLCVTRPLLRKLRVQNIVPTNADAEVGKIALVTEEINNKKDTGRVRIGGVNWRSRTEKDCIIPAGTSVRVTSISGTTAYVALIEQEASGRTTS